MKGEVNIPNVMRYAFGIGRRSSPVQYVFRALKEEMGLPGKSGVPAKIGSSVPKWPI